MSRSGYYAWLNRSGADSLREERDYLDDTLAWTSSFSSKSISKGEMMIHSDQGFHDTHPGYQQLVVDLGLDWSSPCHVGAIVSTTHQSNRSSVI